MVQLFFSGRVDDGALTVEQHEKGLSSRVWADKSVVRAGEGGGVGMAVKGCQ